MKKWFVPIGAILAWGIPIGFLIHEYIIDTSWTEYGRERIEEREERINKRRAKF